MAVGRPFVKGQSGFPAGRTKEQRAKERAFADCVAGLAGPGFAMYAQRLHDIAMDATGEAKDSIKAIEVLLTRALGKAPEHIVHEEPNELTPDEIEAEERIITRERIAKMTPSERLQLLAEVDAGVTTETVQ